MKIYLFALFPILIIAGCTPQSSNMMESHELLGEKPPSSASEMMEKEQAMMERDKAMYDSSVMEKNNLIRDEAAMTSSSTEQQNKEIMIENQEEVPLIAGNLSHYYYWDAALFDRTTSEGKLVYLEFSANWCPVCKQQEKDLVSGFNALSRDGVVGFKIPYKDSDTTEEHEALAKKYGIAYQHTKVILQNGNVLLKSPEAWTSSRFLDEVNKLG